MNKRQSKMISEWPRNLVMVIFLDDAEKINHVNTDGLEKALNTFPEGEFVLLRYKEGLTVREIGERLGVTHDMARNRIEKGIRKIHHPLKIRMFYS